MKISNIISNIKINILYDIFKIIKVNFDVVQEICHPFYFLITDNNNQKEKKIQYEKKLKD